MRLAQEQQMEIVKLRQEGYTAARLAKPLQGKYTVYL